MDWVIRRVLGVIRRVRLDIRRALVLIRRISQFIRQTIISDTLDCLLGTLTDEALTSYPEWEQIVKEVNEALLTGLSEAKQMELLQLQKSWLAQLQ